MGRAVSLHGVRDVRIAAYSAKPRSETVGLDVAAIGICGSDLHYYKDGGIGSATIKEPFVPGHEFAGWLTEDVPQRGLAKGALVAVDPALPCGQCEFCRAGRPNICPNVRFTGAPPYDGAMTEKIWVSPEQVFALPPGMTAEQAVMLEPLGVAVHALRHARPRLLEDVAILGCGPIGLLCLALVRLHAVGRIIAVDPVAHRAELARTYGADAAGSDLEVVRDITQGRGCDLVIEATNSPAGFEDAVGAAAIAGRVVLVGIPDGDHYGLTASATRRRELTIQFSRRMGDVYPAAIALVADGKVDVDRMISHRLVLDEAPRAFDMLSRCDDGSVKALLYPDASHIAPPGRA
ncbi:MAG: alcohol dehydrogenase catalytic domain-containing protein [Rhodospirillaceae bacterium]|nr:alcohol dehydrogenase catalytic domain-containing protein [Rhodospirillaceae bacterium]